MRLQSPALVDVVDRVHAGGCLLSSFTSSLTCDLSCSTRWALIGAQAMACCRAPRLLWPADTDAQIPLGSHALRVHRCVAYSSAHYAGSRATALMWRGTSGYGMCAIPWKGSRRSRTRQYGRSNASDICRPCRYVGRVRCCVRGPVPASSPCCDGLISLSLVIVLCLDENCRRAPCWRRSWLGREECD